MRRYSIEVDGRDFSVDVEDVAADSFQVTVEGKTVSVTLSGVHELVGDADGATAAPMLEPVRASAAVARPAPASAPAKAAPAKAPRRAAASAGGAAGQALEAPMPGVIQKVLVSVGTQVQRGQDIAVLEAMKMQNMIRAPLAGTVTEVAVEVGQKVGHGELIARISAGG